MKWLCLQGDGTKIDSFTRAIASTNDILTHVIVSRSEIDMVQIKGEFQRMYGKTLEATIEVSVVVMARTDVSGWHVTCTTRMLVWQWRLQVCLCGNLLQNVERASDFTYFWSYFVFQKAVCIQGQNRNANTKARTSPSRLNKKRWTASIVSRGQTL